MTFEKNEIRTGILVLVTVGILVAAVLFLGVPGLFRKQKNYSIFFDNASGVKPGAQVLLAGRKIGTVATIVTPVPKNLRPQENPDYEVLIKVAVDADAQVFRDANARMSQLGLLGEQVIDFVGGNPGTGPADPGYTFIGSRAPDFSESIPRIIRILEPVTATATLTLDDLRKTIASLNTFFDKQGELNGALAQIKTVGANFSQITDKENGSLTKTLNNVQVLTAGLSDKNGNLQQAIANFQKTTAALNKDNNIDKILANFQQASARLDNTTKQANALVAALTPSFTASATNFKQMTDTLKREPWRIIWKGSVKEYPDPTTTVTQVPPGQGGPATLVTRQSERGGTATARTNRAGNNRSVPDANGGGEEDEDLRAPNPARRRRR